MHRMLVVVWQCLKKMRSRHVKYYESNEEDLVKDALQAMAPGNMRHLGMTLGFKGKGW